jgi:ABC-type branched-subunit amino acid transport system substrate-binding protein
MKKTYLIAALVLVVLVVSFHSPTKASNPKEINVGFIANLTGQFSDFASSFKDGVELAKEKYEKETGIKVNLIYEDDAFESKRGILAYQKLTSNNHIEALINITTPTIGALKPMLAVDKLPTIQFGLEPDGSQKDTVFTIYPGGVETETKAAKLMASKIKECKNPLLIYSQADTAISQKTNFQKGLEEVNQAKIQEYQLTADTKLSGTDALKVYKEIQPDCLVLEILPADGAPFIKNYLLYAKTIPQMFFGAVFFPSRTEYQKILGDNLMKKLNTSYVSVVETYTSEEYKSAFKEKYKRDASTYSEFGYDAFNVLMKSYSKDKETWVKNIQNTNIKGASSLIRYTNEGSVDPVVNISTLSEALSK